MMRGCCLPLLAAACRCSKWVLTLNLPMSSLYLRVAGHATRPAASGQAERMCKCNATSRPSPHSSSFFMFPSSCCCCCCCLVCLSCASLVFVFLVLLVCPLCLFALCFPCAVTSCCFHDLFMFLGMGLLRPCRPLFPPGATVAAQHGLLLAGWPSARASPLGRGQSKTHAQHHVCQKSLLKHIPEQRIKGIYTFV